jgi:hypothetical protein
MPGDPQDKGRIISELMRIQSGLHETYACPPAQDWLIAEGYAKPCGSDATLTTKGKVKAQQILDAWEASSMPRQGVLFG